ncbi:hypothetical protein SERLA73DRAFT_187510 [Serpula lacrymans var. lacrymans S7.3]|uniref:NADAR domain-containing protein n=2 Tax=Serpula lacrymans var. lacrymans TaxID=341189 RepID=F8Q9C9_SERL3|nr:uncharacterized protein SERLADRAFT_477148 [Serpula lacrymans var. lacrymans S7.9]EGN95184.1 hypothetical protein SERLA73DRAFT_187510 [Serpula lacrymans var. lacrymans S7.3]EGO20713.1 hypothetical protein SERLADRAFT_477148 [Serpula lacrymans var. lacrymans S7.9]
MFESVAQWLQSLFASTEPKGRSTYRSAHTNTPAQFANRSAVQKTARVDGQQARRPHNNNKARKPPSPNNGRTRILFYDKGKPHYGFTNFSPHPILYKRKRYPTSEHLFQAMKFIDHRPDIAERIRTCSDKPSVAFAEAHKFQTSVRPDWMTVNIQKMDEVLWHKFTQHASLKAELLATGNAELVEDSNKDSFWGVGADHRGRNELGKALERLRASLLQGDKKYRI